MYVYVWNHTVLPATQHKWTQPALDTLSQLQVVTSHMESYSVTCHPTQVNTARLRGRHSIYLPRRDGQWTIVQYISAYNFSAASAEVLQSLYSENNSISNARKWWWEQISFQLRFEWRQYWWRHHFRRQTVDLFHVLVTAVGNGRSQSCWWNGKCWGRRRT